jgi:hypothetical protein
LYYLVGIGIVVLLQLRGVFEEEFKDIMDDLNGVQKTVDEPGV